MPQAKPAPFLRRDFAIRGKVRSAHLFASGLGYAELHLNSQKVGGDIERDPGYTNFNKRVLYVTGMGREEIAVSYRQPRCRTRAADVPIK